MIKKAQNFMRLLGPGLLYAGAAVGVSHIVQSTRAGASYGFELLGILIVVNLIKYPFFEFGARYPALTGKSLIEAYKKVGKWAIVLFTLLTFSTMFTIQAAVTIVTASLVSNVLSLSLSPLYIAAMILLLTIVFLIYGKYSFLDKMIKWIIIILSLTTLIAVIAALNKGYSPNIELAQHFSWSSRIDILFLIAFIGWMPAPIDVSIWQSLWGEAKAKEMGQRLSLKQSLLDFNIGYFGTIILALGFLSLGALVMYGSGEKLSPKGSVFAGQLIEMYTLNIGSWAFWIIAIAAIATMFSTTLTCFDAYPRVLKPLSLHFIPSLSKVEKGKDYISWFWSLVLASGTLSLLFFLQSSMRFMVDLATTLSFVTAPLLAFLNYKALSHKELPPLPLWLKYFALTGIVFLSSFALFYLYYRIK